MEGVWRILSSYDEVVATGGGMILSKFTAAWMKKIFPRWTGQLAKFVQSLMRTAFGMWLYSYGQQQNSHNAQFIGLGFAVEGTSAMLEALTNDRLDGMLINGVLGDIDNNESVGFQPDVPTLREIPAPVMVTENEEDKDEAVSGFANVINSDVMSEIPEVQEVEDVEYELV